MNQGLCDRCGDWSDLRADPNGEPICPLLLCGSCLREMRAEKPSVSAALAWWMLGLTVAGVLVWIWFASL